mmetsp:Transcript_37598/g.27721  ORF Transcript_37598/g.27721 Transcript_37598/m.27721 type:complete len:163 (+) Transcript_37598:819-1307(+)
MLMKFVEVDREGSFSLKGDLRILYSTMMFTRCEIVQGAPFALSVGLQIAARYSAVRRQFANVDAQKGVERRIIDYQTQQFKLLTAMAKAFAMIAGSRGLINLHTQLMEDINKDDFSKLELVHHLSSGYKAMFTKEAYENLEKLRQSCGGAGFSCFSGLPEFI